MKMPRTPSNLPDFDVDIDHDPVWDLLDDAPPEAPTPRFAQDLVRRARLEGQEASSWWKSLLSPKPLAGIATAACACAALIISLPSETSDSNPVADQTQTVPDNWEDEFEKALASELLASAAEDPTLLSDAEIVSLLY